MSATKINEVTQNKGDSRQANERLENDVIFNETFASEFRGIAKTTSATSSVHSRQDELDAQTAGKQKRKRTGDSEIDFLVDQVQTVLTREQMDELANNLKERKMEGGFSATSSELIGNANIEKLELKNDTMLELYNGNMTPASSTAVYVPPAHEFTIEASAERIAKETEASIWTQDQAILRELAGRSDDELHELISYYKKITGKNLREVLEQELGGDQKALALDYLKGSAKSVDQDYIRTHQLYNEIKGGFASWVASTSFFGKPELKENMEAEHQKLNTLYAQYQKDKSTETEKALREQLELTRSSIQAFYNAKPNSASSIVALGVGVTATVVLAVVGAPVWVIAGAAFAVGLGARFITKWAVSGSYTDKDFSSDALHAGIEGATALVGGGAAQLATKNFATRLGTRLGAQSADEALAIGQKALEATFKGKVLSGIVSGVGGGAMVGGLTGGVQTGVSEETWKDGVLSGIRKTFSAVWSGSLYGAVWGGAIGGSFGALQWGWGKTVQPVLDKVGEKISSAWYKVTSPITSRVSSAWHTVFDPVAEGTAAAFAKVAFWRTAGGAGTGSTINAASSRSSTSAGNQIDDQLDDILGTSKTYEQIQKGGQALDDQLDDILGSSKTYEQMQAANTQKSAPSQATSESTDLAADMGTKRADIQRRLENLEAQWKSTNRALVDNPADDLARQDLDRLTARARALKEELADIDENWFDDLFGSGGSGGGNGTPRPESPMGGPSRSQTKQQYTSTDAVSESYGQPSPAYSSPQPKAQVGVLEMEAPAPAAQPRMGRIIHVGDQEEIAIHAPIAKDDLRKNVSRMLGQSDVIDMQSPMSRPVSGSAGVKATGSQTVADEVKPFAASDAPPTRVVPNFGTNNIPGAEFGTAAAAVYGYSLRPPFIAQRQVEEDERRQDYFVYPQDERKEEKRKIYKAETEIPSSSVQIGKLAAHSVEEDDLEVRRRRIKAKGIIFGGEEEHEFVVTKVEKA